MYIKNIREVKQNLRAQCRRSRSRMEPDRKAALDVAIRERFLSLREYAGAEVLFTYVSKPLEVDTRGMISRALAAGRRIAAPLCIPQTLGMRFYEIRSMEDLVPGRYGVLEPDPARCAPAGEAGPGVLCVVPGLSFDSQGYRLGYGRGYYDRFLAGFGGVTVGLCYSGCVRWDLPHGYYDRPVDILVTEKYVRRLSDGHLNS
ncbi:MAG TPA: 5-formyltetrahydrofolate cyclo-ligase [Ruminococcaceae bacterium]|jgi:5-formyltetrahydrofolate cyclo-ligase|nr:5-formyltetrahydrofolate cyclo-ligase [Oscillospiraceae bacterium]